MRDGASYERFAFACNGLDELDALPGGLGSCKLSSLTEQERSFLVERSLLGDVDFAVKAKNSSTKRVLLGRR